MLIQITCQRTFTLPVELRTTYKMQLAPFRIGKGVIEIEDGPNGILTRYETSTLLPFSEHRLFLTNLINCAQINYILRIH